jgi:hypothetical protein
MSTPELGPSHERLAELAGRWRGTETLAPSPWSPGGESDAELTFAVAAGGFALVQDYRSERDGETLMTGHGVFSVDPAAGDVLWHWFDSIGYPPLEPAVGAFAHGGLVLERSTARGTNRTTWSLHGDTLTQAVEFRAAAAPGFETLVSARFTRER